VQILVPEIWAEHARRVLAKEYTEEDLDWKAEEPEAESNKQQGEEKEDQTG
jgi:hypothetical protein